MDYLAKLFYRLYDHTLFFPENISIRNFFEKSFQHYIPFTPYTIDDFTKFHKKLSDRLQSQTKHNANLNKKTPRKLEFNSNQLHRLSRETSDSLKIKKPNYISSTFLFYSISYAALRDVWQDIENYHRSNTSVNAVKPSEFPEKNIAKCLMVSHSIIEYMVNKKYRIQIHEIPKLIRDSIHFTDRAAATKNSKNWLWCSKCMKKNSISLFVNGKCPRCQNSRKKVWKIDFKSIQILKVNVVNDMLFLQNHRPEFDTFMNYLSSMIRNELDVNRQYIGYFEKYENQVFNSESSYLRKYNFRMCHYDSENSSKKKSHSLTEKEILNSNLIESKYIVEIHSFVLNSSKEGMIRINQILHEYNYPTEFTRKKILHDLLWMQIYLKFKKNTS